jgi:hypothetical protein
MADIINTVFPVYQGLLPLPYKLPFSPGAGINEIHPVGTEAGDLAPGVGLAIEVKASNLGSQTLTTRP